MKKLFTFLVILLHLSSFAQFQLDISGYVYESSPQGQTVPGQLIQIDIQGGGDTMINGITVTNEAGFYQFFIETDGTQGSVSLSTAACNDTITYQHGFFGDSTVIQQDFVICDNGGNECQAFFGYINFEDLTVNFVNNSVGSDLSYQWEFGDGSTSAEANPQHTYELEGVYDVCLYITAADSSCFDAYCQPVMVGGNVPPECAAMFDFTLLGDLTVDFQNVSMGNSFVSSWDFGDGQTSAENNPVHTYDSTGTYEVTLTIVDTIIPCTSTVSGLVYLSESGTCVADFTYISFPNNFNQLEFMNLSTGDIATYSWDFGDGNTSNEINPVHNYLQAGEYNVCLSVMSNDTNCYDFSCQQVIVGGDSLVCQAMFTTFALPSNDSIYPSPLALQFWDMSIGNPVSWIWEFGNGDFSTEQNPVYTFSAPGIYNVCLTIQGAGEAGCTSTYCDQIIVYDNSADCVAQFVSYPDSSNTMLGMWFYDLSYGEGISSWSWDFGDGTFSSEQNPVHNFDQQGVYQVCLTISGEFCQSTWCEDVTVGVVQPCFNYFTYQNAGNTVLFNGNHSSAVPAYYFWEFGDGTTGEGSQVSHTYDAPGIYYVNLFTNDDNQCFAVSSQMIVLGDSIAYNQLYGQVFEGNLPMDEGLVMLFSLDTIGNFMPFFEGAITDASGIYTFPYVPQGNFLLYAMSLDSEDYMPTYFGDVINWENASVISLGQPQNPYNINLVASETNTVSGNNSINGLIGNNAIREGFMDKIKVLLFNENNESLGFTEVNSDGSFGFANLAQGIYYIYPELTGVTADKVRVDLTGENAVAQVNMTFNGNNITGIQGLEARIEVGDLYPNPVVESLHLAVKAKQNTFLNWQIVGVDGRLQAAGVYNLHTDGNEIEINVSQLPQGVYILQLIDDNQQQTFRKFIK